MTCCRPTSGSGRTFTNGLETMPSHPGDSTGFSDPASIVIHGDDGLERTADIAPPLHPTSTFAAVSADEFASMATDARHPRYYTRYGNPTNERGEAILAALEGAEASMLTASGMGALSTAVLTLVSAGDH